MNNSSRVHAGNGHCGRRVLMVAFAVLAAGLFRGTLKLPLWQMRLEAPQYRDEEALRIAIFPNAMAGDLRELAVLNQYIGVHVPPTLPQFKWLPWALIAGAVGGLLASALPHPIRRVALAGTALALMAALAMAAVQARTQMRHIGHQRDQKTILVGVHDFTPPFLGTAKIAQFEVSSRFGFGAWLVGAALTLQFAAAWLSRPKQPPVPQSQQIEAQPGALNKLPAAAAGSNS